MRVWFVRLCFVIIACVWCQVTGAESPRVDRIALLIARGQQRADIGDHLSAIGYFRDAIGQAPRDPRGYRALARAYLDTDQAQRAVEVYEAAVSACGEHPDLLLALAQAQDRCNRPEVALLILRTLTERADASIEVHELRAQIAERIGKFAEALGARRAALSLRVLGGDQEGLRDAALHVKALGLLAGEADRLNHGDCCAPGTTAIRRALADCREAQR